MDQHDAVTLATVLNPWQPQTQRAVRAVVHAPGRTVAEYLRDAGVSAVDGVDLAVSWNGRVLTQSEMERFTPRPGDYLAVCARPHGGDSSGKDVVKMVAMIAVAVIAIVAAPYAAGAIVAGLGAVGVGVSAGVGAALTVGSMIALNVAGSMLVNTLLPGAKADSSAYNWGESSSTYAWGTTANLMREGLAIPVIYGTMLITPPVIAAHVRAASDGTEYLNILYALGEGPLSVEQDAAYSDQLAVYINDQHFSAFARDTTVAPQHVRLTGTASASSTSNAAMFAASRACDGSTDVRYRWVKATSDSSPWWSLDLGSGMGKIVNAYNICLVESLGAQSWTLYGSNNGSTWTSLDTRSSLSPFVLTRYTFTNTTAYRYYKLTGLAQIVEVEFFAADAEDTTTSSVDVTARDGSNTQGAIPAFAKTYAMESSWTAVRVTTTYTERELTGSAITGIVVGLSFPYGLYGVDNSGNKVEIGVNVTLQYCTYSGGAWGAWTDWGAYQINANCVGSYKWTRELSNLTAGQYKVRLKWTTQPNTSTQYVNTAYWEYAETAISDELTYPNTALLGLCVLATDQLSGSMPRVTALTTRQYVTVDVSGTPTDKPANNPAWAAYDMLANARYGGGVDTDDIIYAEFSAWADFCDNPDSLSARADSTAYSLGARVVPATLNGYCYRCTVAGTSAGSAPTWPTTDGATVTDGGVTWSCEDYAYQINVVFDTATSLAGALTDIALAGHGIVVQRGCQYGVIIDQPATATQLFGMGNIVKDSFKINYLNLDQRANCVEVTYWDRERDYTKTVIEVRASGFDAGTETEKNSPAVTLYGCTSRRAAVKYGRYVLRQNALVGHVITFDAGIDAIAVLPGDVFKFAHDVPQWQYSGRITVVDPADGEDVTSITLDQAIYCEAAKTYKLQVRESNDSDALVDITLDAVPTNGSYSTFTCSAVTGVLLPGDVYIFGESTETTKLYRCLSITRAQEQTRQITAAVYDASLYTDTEDIPAPETPAAVVGVANLRVAEVTRDGVLMASLVWDGQAIDWNITTEVYVAGAWQFDSVTNSAQQTWCEIPVTKGVAHRFTVRSVWPADSESVTTSVLGTREWSFDVKLDVAFSDGKPDKTHSVRIGWKDKDYRDDSDNVDFQVEPTVTRPDAGVTYLENYNSIGPSPVPDVNANWWRTTGTYNSLPVWTTTVGGSTWYLWAHVTGGNTYWTISTAAGSTSGAYWRQTSNSATPSTVATYSPNGTASGTLYVATGLTSSGYAYSKKWIFPAPGLPTDYLVEDYRDIGSYSPWYLVFNVGYCCSTATLRWDQNAVPYEHPMYLQEVDSAGVPTGTDVDMSAQSSLTISADCYYRIHLGESTETFDITLKPGWNLVSTPLYPTTCDIAVVFTASVTVKQWDADTQALMNTDVFLPRVGYWVHNNGASDIVVTVTGWRPPQYVTRYLQGPASGASTATREAIGFCAGMPVTFPPCTKGYMQKFNATTGAYETVTTAVEGEGYWVDVTADGQIQVNERE